MIENRNATETRYEHLDENTVKVTIDDLETGIRITMIVTLPDKILQLSESEITEILTALLERLGGCVRDLPPGTHGETEK